MRTEQSNLWSEGIGGKQTIWLTAVILLVTLILGVTGSFAGVEASSDGIDRGAEADSARYEAMGEFYLAKSEAAHSARWAALASAYGQGAESYLAESEAARCAGLPCLASFYAQGSASQTDVSKFYAERTRAQADQEELAVNPELIFARARYGQSLQSLGACVRSDDNRLAANPELGLAAKMGAC